jgi:hypothetical protein
MSDVITKFSKYMIMYIVHAVTPKILATIFGQPEKSRNVVALV